MTDFRIWGTVNQIGPREFVVIVTAGSEPIGESILERSLQPSRQAALAIQIDLIAVVAAKVRERGGTVIDVEYAE